MRIAYLTQSYPPMISGAAGVVRQLSEAMAQRGHEVLVIAASDKENPYHTYRKNLTIRRLRSFVNPLRVGQRLILHPRPATLRALKIFRPDIIHTHEPLQMGGIGLAYARCAHIPITLTIHQLPGFVASYLPHFLQGVVTDVLWLYANWLSRKFTSLITPTQTIANLIKGMTGLQAETISSGVDLKSFHPSLPGEDGLSMRQKWNLPPGAPMLLHVGRLDTDKRVERVIQAAARAMSDTDAHLLIVGDGTQKTALIHLCESLNMAERVHFTGYIPAADGLSDIYRMAHLFLMASEIETQGIVLLEAAASGLPIVAIRATCIPEIVHDGVNGFLVEPDDIESFANRVKCLLLEREKARIMGQAGIALAHEHEIQHTLDLHEDLYLKLIQEARACKPIRTLHRSHKHARLQHIP
jgi:1,2-diacylglycerol 3-alpha-glucosyltransferase